jgi:hypothetical protein
MRIGKRDVTHQPVRRHRPILAWRPRWRTLNQGKRINRIGRRNPIRHPAGANPTIACCVQRQSRVARWFVFKPKIKIWIKFRGPWRGKCCHILWPFGIFYCHLVYFIAVWCSLWSFGIYFGMYVPRKIWQPCGRASKKLTTNLHSRQIFLPHTHTGAFKVHMYNKSEFSTFPGDVAQNVAQSILSENFYVSATVEKVAQQANIRPIWSIWYL